MWKKFTKRYKTVEQHGSLSVHISQGWSPSSWRLGAVSRRTCWTRPGSGWGSGRIREWRFTFYLMLRNRFYNPQLYSADVYYTFALQPTCNLLWVTAIFFVCYRYLFNSLYGMTDIEQTWAVATTTPPCTAAPTMTPISPWLATRTGSSRYLTTSSLQVDVSF